MMMRAFVKARSAVLLAGVAGGLVVTPAWAQEVPAGKEADTTSADIIVTAQRREERLQDIAAAATALSGDALQDRGVQRLDDLQTAAPALSISDAGLTQSVNIRGVGLASGSPSVTNGVATYVDGVFQPPIVSTNSFYDLGTVEVFRGPQGTFVGSNSTGGAIFINSRSPVLGATEGYAELTAGNYQAFGGEGALNLPVGETLALRGAVKYRRRDSFYTDIGPLGNKPGRLDEIAGRIGALWQPVEAFRALLKVEMAGKETGGYAYRPFTGSAYAGYRRNDIRELDYDSPTRNDERALQASLELRYETDGGTTLRSISGYQNKRVFNLYDADSTNAARYAAADLARLPVTTSDQFVRERVWTQEVNLISPTDGRLSWILGGYFQRNVIDVDITQKSNGFPTDIDILTHKTTLGAFGQATYKLTPQFALDIGARYSHYTTNGQGSVAIGAGIPGFPVTGLPVANLDRDHKDGRVTGKISLNWTPNADNLIYAFVARGYKPGGFTSATVEFRPETVIDYEAGWKSTFAGGHLTTQVGGFYYDYKDFQFDVLDPTTGQVNPVNLASATLKGLEAQVQARAGGFTFDAGVAYVDSSLGSVSFVDQRAASRALPGVTFVPQCPAGQPTTIPACIDYTPFVRNTAGGPNLFSPRWTYNLGAQYAFEVGDVRIAPRVNYAYIGPQFTYIGYSPISDRLAGRGVLNAQISARQGNVEVELYGTNLADVEYVTGQSQNNEFYGAPREFGVRARVNF
ncbi:TonB-dependent receptor [Sphingomonas adhaesiva]|uniref:TonB-dependent receptor n=1 Tax=Sphingomonas adhaesiva TaxID=28212 RepID=UPI002FFB34AF